MSNLRNIVGAVKKTAINDAGLLLCKISVIHEANLDKWNSIRDLTTTETINNVDLHTLYELATKLNQEVILPNSSVAGSHVILNYQWGGIVIIANVTMN